MKTLLLLLALAVPASAQNIILKDGKTVVTKGVRRQADTIMATIEMPGGDPSAPPKTGEIGYQISQIAKIDFPEPPQLRALPEMIARGMSSDALGQLDPIVRYFEPFRDAPGSWWAPAALLKTQALASLGRDKEADVLAEQLTKAVTDPETSRAASMQLATGLVRKGDFKKAREMADAALKESKAAGTRSAAAIIKGQCLLQEKDYENALLSFLLVPVFYPGEKVYLPASMLGEGRAHFGLEDLPGARAPLEELRKTYASSPEAKLAEEELQKIARREKALADPK